MITFAGVVRRSPGDEGVDRRAEKVRDHRELWHPATSLVISPAIVATGARQNVSNTVADNSAVVKVGAARANCSRPSMAFHRTLHLRDGGPPLPDGVDFAARKVMTVCPCPSSATSRSATDVPVPGIVLFGYAALRPELALAASTRTADRKLMAPPGAHKASGVSTWNTHELRRASRDGGRLVPSVKHDVGHPVVHHACNGAAQSRTAHARDGIARFAPITTEFASPPPDFLEIISVVRDDGKEIRYVARPNLASQYAAGRRTRASHLLDRGLPASASSQRRR